MQPVSPSPRRIGEGGRAQGPPLRHEGHGRGAKRVTKGCCGLAVVPDRGEAGGREGCPDGTEGATGSGGVRAMASQEVPVPRSEERKRNRSNPSAGAEQAVPDSGDAILPLGGRHFLLAAEECLEPGQGPEDPEEWKDPDPLEPGRRGAGPRERASVYRR